MHGCRFAAPHYPPSVDIGMYDHMPTCNVVTVRHVQGFNMYRIQRATKVTCLLLHTRQSMQGDLAAQHDVMCMCSEPLVCTASL